jgi:hypothetical protein
MSHRFPLAPFPARCIEQGGCKKRSNLDKMLRAHAR